MGNRNYLAGELVTFAKLGIGKPHCGEYLVIGYFNNDKSKFLDIKTGIIYPVVFSNNSKNGWSNAIEILGQDYVQIEMSVAYNKSCMKYKYIQFSENCIFTKLRNECFIDFDRDDKYKHLYDYVLKKKNTSLGAVATAVSTDNILCAIDEANKYADSWVSVYGEEEKEQETIKKESGLSLTEEERNF